MPPEEMFCGTETLSRSEGYYATLVHELTRRETQARSHVSANASAVRPTPPRNWSLKFGAAFLCAEFQITQDVRADHARISRSG